MIKRFLTSFLILLLSVSVCFGFDTSDSTGGASAFSDLTDAPSNATGALTNNGSGTLSWETYLTSEVDGSTTNEINTITGDDSDTTSGLAVTIAGAGTVSTAVSGDTVTITGTAVTLSTDLGNNLLGLSTQELTIDNQTANYVFAGPASGSAAAPAFRLLTDDDIPELSGVGITLGDEDSPTTEGLMGWDATLDQLEIGTGATTLTLSGTNSGDNAVNTTYDTDGDGSFEDEAWFPGSGITWEDKTDSFTAVSGHGYVIKAAGNLTVTMPTPSVHD